MCFITAAMAGTAAAATSANVALATTVLSVGMGAYGQYQQSKGMEQQAKYQAKVHENNAKVSEWKAQDAQQRGERDAQDIRRQGAALRGRQRSTMAARGLDLSVGSAAQIIDDTDFFTMADQQTARQNAAKEAWGHRAQGAGHQAQAGLSVAQARNQNPALAAGSSLLGGAGSVADRWYSYSGG